MVLIVNAPDILEQLIFIPVSIKDHLEVSSWWKKSNLQCEEKNHLL